MRRAKIGELVKEGLLSVADATALNADSTLELSQIWGSGDAVDVGIRYASVSGNDANDGLSWQTAFRTLTKARADLVGGTGFAIGTIRLGHGVFSEGETFPIEINEDLHIIGLGTGFAAADESGTHIKLQAGKNVNMFEPDAGLSVGQFIPSFTLANLQINGNESVQTGGPSNGLVTQNGGTNFVVENVRFRNCRDAGWKHTGNALNVVGRDLLFEGCGSAIDFERNLGAGWTVSFEGNIQIDECGPIPVKFTDSSPIIPFDIAQIRLSAFKSQANAGGATIHDPLIQLETSHTNARGFNVLIDVMNATHSNSDPPSGRTLVKELAATGSGRASRVIILHAAARGYNTIFESLETGLKRVGKSLTGSFQLDLHGFDTEDFGALEVAAAVTLDWEHSKVNMESTGGTRVVTLPDCASFDGKEYLVRRDGTNTVTINRAGSDTFSDGDTTKTLDTDAASIQFFSVGGTEWKIIRTEGTVGGA